MGRRSYTSFLALSLLLGACSDAPIEDLPGGTVLAAYVLLGASADAAPRAHARVIVPSTESFCPELIATDGRGHPMRFRDNPHGFSVRVCETEIPFDETLRVSWNQQTLPTATMNPERLLLFGDTGCKTKDCEGDAPAKPFEDLARSASEIEPRPQLILHAGDYNYRGTPSQVNDDPALVVYDAGDEVSSPACRLDVPYVSQNAGYSDGPDSWEAWRVDFFEPAGDLLTTAPFIFARGNHELCSRAGPGWFYFLDSSANAEGSIQLACPPQGDASPPAGDVFAHLLLTPPRTIDLGTLRIVVVDSANACDDFAPATTTGLYAEQLRTAVDGLVGDTTTWFLSHRPFWGLEKLCADDDPACTPQTINKTLQGAVSQLEDGGTTVPSSVRLLVSGHMHLFQSTAFSLGDDEDGRPPTPQIVVGNGGVEASSGPGDGSFSVAIAGATAKGLTSTKHGFTHIPALAPNGAWRGVVINPHESETIAECGQPLLDGTLCRPADG